MHPAMTHQLAHIRLADGHRQAERERRLRTAGSSRPTSIDAAPFRGRLRRRIFRLGQGIRGAAAGA